MNPKSPVTLSCPCPWLICSFTLFFCLQIRATLCAVHPNFTTCVPKSCGDGQNISYPFYIKGVQPEFCGYPNFDLSCSKNGHPILNLSNTAYIVQKISYQDESIRVSDPNFSLSNTTSCVNLAKNFTYPGFRFSVVPNQTEMFLFFGCDLGTFPQRLLKYQVGCSAENLTRSVLGLTGDDGDFGFVSRSCNGGTVKAMVENASISENEGILGSIKRGFLLKWAATNCSECMRSGGKCGFDRGKYSFQCFCPDRPHAWDCDDTAENGNGYQGKCPESFICGNLGRIHFPFTKAEQLDCGLLAIHGCDDGNFFARKTVQLEKNGRWFEVKSVIQNQNEYNFIKIVDEDLNQSLAFRTCDAFKRNFTLPPNTPLVSFHMENITLFRCNRNLNLSFPKRYFNHSCGDYVVYYAPPTPNDDNNRSSLIGCSVLQLPKHLPDCEDLFTFVSGSIYLQVRLSDNCFKCYRKRGGLCQHDSNKNFYCTKDDKKALRLGLGLGLGVGFPLVAVLIIGYLIRHRHKKKKPTPDVHSESRDIYADPHPDSGHIYFGFGVPVFSYKELQEATNNFDNAGQIGDGGFGSVYYGKLRDGREVAVKRLYEHNYRRLEQFMNEVEILTRLRHGNLVSLYGCTSHRSHELLLVYEFIPNGTVACHLHVDSTKPGFLPWSIRMKIAIETATALAYLHASDIIHRDVKTNNILLDNSYSVKVADFGLSRLFPTDVTHVSTAPQGTPGYVDPEYHQYYQLTSKSDVFSFGVVLIELISSMPAVDMNRHSDEINLSSLAVKKIQSSALSELVDPSLGFESDENVKRMIVSVAELAFQCLQRDKELRPSMDDVLKLLRRIEGGNNGPQQLEEAAVHSAGMSNSNVHPPPPPSPACDQLALLRNVKQPSSPNSVIDNWDSKSTTPNVSG
ncbi:hypothetical protein L6164_001684 [Bauhinia variegata]|uniref:Uncharacterized protein n=2 Tax=Bauhinia variegata TaxID=167791 RepID=A0ACB9QAI7_BAUVA|nr:hypothetical protein L6164_001684 [Bauhinia variegata]